MLHIQRSVSLVFLVLLLAAGRSEAQFHSFEAGSVVVALKASSGEYRAWSDAGRAGELPALRALIGEHTSRGYIGNALLQAWQQHKRFSGGMQRAGLNGAADAIVNDPIAGLCVVEFTQPLNPVWLVGKLRACKFIDFAEPLFKREFLFQPNDPLKDQQNHLQRISAFEAWDLLPQNGTALVAIVDTGYDFDHEDLRDAFWINPGEDGLDAQNQDRRSNGFDDDGNGFVDDWRGWDFVSTPPGGDNNPTNGNEHGVHVSGIAGATVNNGVGVAGVGLGVKILPVKIGPDPDFQETTSRGHEGILYAATLGADVINCSWGGFDYSRAERMIIDEATAMGSLVVASVGNEGIDATRFPAGYAPVLSVAWTTADDRVSGSSNRHTTVDISSPGSSIVSTLPNDNYGGPSWNGTSMAAPMVSAAAAMVKMRWPTLTPQQIKAQVLNAADNIDDRNSGIPGRYGSGRLNCFEAVRERKTAAGISDIRIIDANGNGAVELGEDVTINFTVTNYFGTLINLRVEADDETEEFQADFSRGEVVVGGLAEGESRQVQDQGIVLSIPEGAPSNHVYYLTLNLRESGETIGHETIRLQISPTYATIYSGEMTLSFNNEGKLGYNDYADNNEGDGIRYKNSENLVYEGGLILATSPDDMLSAVHESVGFAKADFLPLELPLVADEVSANWGRAARGTTKFRDGGSAPGLQVSVDQRIDVYQPDQSFEPFTHLVYHITNAGQTRIENMYGALYFDWDINPDGLGDKVEMVSSGGNPLRLNYGYVYNSRETSLPYIAVMGIAPDERFAFYAFENAGTNGSLETSPTFTNGDKWLSMINGAARTSAGPADVSMLIGEGPVSLEPQSTHTMHFLLFGGADLAEIQAKAQLAEEFMNVTSSVENGVSATGGLTFSPNPVVSGEAAVRFNLVERQELRISVSDALGRTVQQFVRPAAAGSARFNLNTAALSAGAYYLAIDLENGERLGGMFIVR